MVFALGNKLLRNVQGSSTDDIHPCDPAVVDQDSCSCSGGRNRVDSANSLAEEDRSHYL